MKAARLFLFAIVLICVPFPGYAAAPWHLPGWRARAVVEVPHPLAEADVDTVGVKVLCQGQAQADGRDYRVLDEAGKPLPFQIMFHDVQRYSLISFRATNPPQRFFIYFDNPRAAQASEQIIAPSALGGGPPKASWIPRYGLVLQTIQRPEGDDPMTVSQMAKLIAGSPYKHGARYQQRIADGYNSFGSSDYYISIYRGWMKIPKAGTYQFCTISNEASFSFLDGKPLVHWPGRHTVARGIHGEKHAAVTLIAGLHYIEYYHEETTLDQMAFLGWRPSADAGPFTAIPENVFTAPHRGIVTRYESPTGPLLTFEPAITDSIWPTERHEGQYTRCHLTVPPKVFAATTTYEWDFGDGQTAVGAAVDHIYLAVGKYAVTLSAQSSRGTAIARWPLEIFEIEHVTDQFKEGQSIVYAQIVHTYDPRKLNETGLGELAHLLAESHRMADAIRVGKLFTSRFSTSGRVPEIRRLIADCSIRLGKSSLDEAIREYRASITKDTPVAERIEILARLIRLVGIERDRPQKVPSMRAEAEHAFEQSPRNKDTARAYGDVLIAVGDVLLRQKNRTGARELYRQAESLGPFIPGQVRAARVGAYPNAIREFIAGGNYGAALDLVARWERTFPTDKLAGQTSFWRGKLLSLRGENEQAALFLELAARLGAGAGFESEARWLLAQSLEKTGQAKRARHELARLVATGFQDRFTALARQKLASATRTED